MGDLTGQRVAGRYAVDRLAGQGGMGTVYRATDTSTGEPVALKVITGERLDAVERFEREIEVLAGLTHPGIVRHVGHGRTADDDPFLAMEWLEGEDVAQRLSRSRLAHEQAIALVGATANALAEVHTRGIVHRDIKPSNVFLRDGAPERPVLLDFGIARRADAANLLTKTGMMLGTPQYMSPEQVRGEKDLGPACDVFSLGCVLFECITGRPAFAGEHAMAVLAKILLEDPPRVSELVPGVPAGVDRLLRAMLSKKREERPGCTEVASMLGGLADGDLPASIPNTTRLTGRERRLVSVVLASDPAPLSGYERTITSMNDARARERLEAAIQRLGGQLSPIGSTDIVVTIPPDTVAVDQAATAARCARVIADMMPELAVAVAMGWAEIDPIPVGEVIDRAASMLALGSPGRIRVDDVSASLLELRFDVGGEPGQRTLETERATAEPPRLLLGRSTPCVGRDRELGVLTGLASEAFDDRVARVAHVIASAGVGKSRLRHELATRIVNEHPSALVLLARAEAFRTHASLDAIGQIIRDAASIRSNEDVARARTLLLERVRAAGVPNHDPADLAAFLGEIASIPFDDEASPRLANARRENRIIGELMLEAWLAWIGHEVTRRPIVLVLEDLHWADAQTVRYVDTALRDLAEQPLLVVALSRPEVRERFPNLFRDRSVQEIALPPLTARSAERLVRAALGELPAADLERIVRQSEGNPLYIEEMVRAAASGRGDVAPGSVVAMMQSRLEVLETTQRRVLRAASIFGESFEVEDVSALTGVDARPIFDALVEREVMHRRRVGDSALAFRHALVREAAYAMLTPDDRQHGHALAAGVLEKRESHEAVVIAEHYDRAQARVQAATWYLQAARQASRKNDFDAAVARADAAIERTEDPEVRGAALAARGKARASLGNLVDAQRDLEEGLAMAPGLAPERRIEHLEDLWFLGTFRQDADLLRRSGENAQAVANTIGRGDLAAEANIAIATAEHCEGACTAAMERFRTSFPAAREQPSPVVGIASLVLYHTGAYVEGESVMRRMMRVAKEQGAVTAEIIITSNLGMCLSSLGCYGEAREHFERSRALATRFGLTMLLARALSTSTGHALDVYDLEGTERRAHETQQVGGVIEFATPRVSACVDLAFVAVRRGDIAGALAMVDKVGAAIAEGKGFHGWIWRIRLGVLAAEIFAAQGNWEAAARQAASCADGALPFRRVKYRHLAEQVRVRALAKLGRHDEAVAHARRVLEEARTYPDPTMLMRAAVSLLDITRDEGAHSDLASVAGRIEGALPDARSQEAFRAGAPLAHVG